MDTRGFSQVGRYGTISLMKRNDEYTAVTSFGIDTEELTFGRATTCGVRLYYPDVALLHCKVVFEERKAFLVVLGESGVLVDGCKVFPRTSNNLSTIIPLANNSEFEIHSKRFRFSYPPKEIRATLFATPARPRDRALRLSMINSAQVFSPQPSKDPRENLRILQSPLQNSFKSPVKPSLQEEEQIILVQGSHPRVVQEERDLVILEDVALAPPSPQANLELPRTPPRRKSLGGNALHRAVLIRSAQKAILKAEKEREEEEEEMEVLGAVVTADDEDEYEDNENEDIEMASPTHDDHYLDEAEQPERENQKFVWRKSLEKIMWPFGASEDTREADGGGRTAGDFEDDEDNGVPTSPPSMDVNRRSDGFKDEDEDESEAPAPLPSRSNLPYTPIRRAFGSFMTPQAKPGSPSHANQATDARPPGGRFSLAGGEARRVVVQQPWRVKDIVIPPLPATPSSSTRRPEKAANSSQAPNNSLHDVMTSPGRMRTPMRTPTRPILTEEERKAIQERRRSALKEPPPFFPGGAPGMTPSKPKSSSRSSSPIKRGSLELHNSPMKGHIIHEEDGEMSDKGAGQEDKAEEEEDTRSLLDRMKETVDQMRRRRSVALGITTTRAAEGPSSRPLFAPITTPQRPLFQPELHEVVDSVEDQSNEMREEEPFSLLRPGARDEVVSRLTPAILEVESCAENSIPLPIVVVDPVYEDDSPEIQDGPEVQEQPMKTKEGRSRLLRAPKSIDVVASPNVEEEQKETNSEPRSKSTGPETRRSRSRTPQPSVPEVATTSRRTRKATAEPEEDQPVVIPPTAAGKRGRKAPVSVDMESPKANAKGLPAKLGQKVDLSAEDEEQHAESSGGDQTAEAATIPAAAPAKRSRSRKALQETLDQEESIPPVPVITKAGTRKKTTPNGSNGSRIRGTRKAAAARALADDVDEEDPLDSYKAVEEDEDEDEDADLPGPPPPSRINNPKTKSRKKAATTVAVKEEQDDEQHFSDLEEAPLAAAKTTATRGSGTKNGGRATPTARTPASKNRGKKTRTKTPATAPASTTLVGSDKDVDLEKDKENTPGSTGVSADGEDSGQTQTQAPTVKVRVSRSRGAAAAVAGNRTEGTVAKMRTGSTRSAGKAVKVEVVEEAVVEPVRVRTRARTKTG